MTVQDEKDKKTFIDAADARKKDADSDLTKFLNKAYGKKIEEHTYISQNQIKSIRGLNIVAQETGDDFFKNIANDLMTLQLSEEGKNRFGIERVFTGVYSPALTYKRQEIETGNGGEGTTTQQVKKTKKGILRRFF